MKLSHTDGNAAALPPIWVIGFTGHRHLQDPESLGRSLQTLLQSLRQEIPGQLFAYSSVAIGADAVFADVCVGLGLPWTGAQVIFQIVVRNHFLDTKLQDV